jgi:hypothetical protein
MWEVCWMWQIFASRRKPFTAASLNMVSKNLILTAIHWNKNFQNLLQTKLITNRTLEQEQLLGCLPTCERVGNMTWNVLYKTRTLCKSVPCLNCFIYIYIRVKWNIWLDNTMNWYVCMFHLTYSWPILDPWNLWVYTYTGSGRKPWLFCKTVVSGTVGVGNLSLSTLLVKLKAFQLPWSTSL